MDNFFTFSIEGKPVGKGRPRFWGGRAVTPQKTRDYEKQIRKAYIDAGGVMHEKALSVHVNVMAYFVPPQSSTKKFKASVESGKVPYTKKPDVDNILKIALDALNGVAWLDDALVVGVSADKAYGKEERLDISFSWEERYPE